MVHNKKGKVCRMSRASSNLKRTWGLMANLRLFMARMKGERQSERPVIIHCLGEGVGKKYIGDYMIFRENRKGMHCRQQSIKVETIEN